jgi:hypothetical protein
LINCRIYAKREVAISASLVYFGCRVDVWLEQKEETGGERAGAASEDDCAGRF